MVVFFFFDWLFVDAGHLMAGLDGTEAFYHRVSARSKPGEACRCPQLCMLILFLTL
jgi:hypothetical protein